MPKKLTPEKELWNHVKTFVERLQISCPETVCQSDRVIEAAYDFIEGCCDIVGYYKYPDED